MALLDVHVMLNPRTSAKWKEQCLASITQAQAQAGFAVALHIVSSVPDHLGFARHQAYRQGSAEYVTSVDDDDFIDRHAFALMKDGIRNHADALFPKERLIPIEFSKNGVIEGSPQRGRQRHSMKVFQRRHLIDHHRWRWAGDIAQLTYLERLPALIDLDTCYNWRHYITSNSIPLRLRWPDELALAWNGQHAPMNSCNEGM